MTDINTQRVIVERHHGWEGASPSLLARVFGTTPQRITAICAQTCAGCGRHICGCPDPVWSGVLPPAVIATPIHRQGASL